MFRSKLPLTYVGYSIVEHHELVENIRFSTNPNIYRFLIIRGVRGLCEIWTICHDGVRPSLVALGNQWSVIVAFPGHIQMVNGISQRSLTILTLHSDIWMIN